MGLVTYVSRRRWLAGHGEFAGPWVVELHLRCSVCSQSPMTCPGAMSRVRVDLLVVGDDPFALPWDEAEAEGVCWIVYEAGRVLEQMRANPMTSLQGTCANCRRGGRTGCRQARRQAAWLHGCMVQKAALSLGLGILIVPDILVPAGWLADEPPRAWGPRLRA